MPVIDGVTTLVRGGGAAADANPVGPALVDETLFDLSSDSLEINNLAYDERLAATREELLDVVEREWDVHLRQRERVPRADRLSALKSEWGCAAAAGQGMLGYASALNSRAHVLDLRPRI